MGSRWRYLFGEVGIGLRRNLLMTLATILTVTVTLTMVGTALLVQRQVDLAQSALYADVEVNIYLEDSITPEQRTSLEEALRAQPVVSEVLYESKEEALVNARELFDDDPLILEGVTADVLPASFRVQLEDPEEFEIIRSQFTGQPGVEEIRDQNEVLQTLFTLMSKLREFSVAIALLMALAAVSLVATTIRLTAYARREQTGIMKLVGATNWYIRLPFVAEGVVASVIGAFAALVVLLAAMPLYVEGLSETILILPFVDSADVIAIFPTMLFGSIIVGAATSVIALRRFLAV